MSIEVKMFNSRSIATKNAMLKTKQIDCNTLIKNTKKPTKTKYF